MPWGVIFAGNAMRRFASVTIAVISAAIATALKDGTGVKKVVSYIDIRP
jgi:hypothetical protein